MIALLGKTGANRPHEFHANNPTRPGRPGLCLTKVKLNPQKRPDLDTGMQQSWHSLAANAK